VADNWKSKRARGQVLLVTEENFNNKEKKEQES
jgi:hypothetical protein